MATALQTSPPSETAILSRLIRPDEDNLPPAAAEAWLKIRFESGDLDRIHELVTKNQGNALTPDERAELESYLRVSAFLDLMHAKARRSLKRRA
jgi:hypothetical protein